MNEHDLITAILRREGWDKYTDHPADRGGPTKWGITLTAWRDFKHDNTLTAIAVQQISEDQARDFYRFVHIVQPGFDKIVDADLRELLIDCGVNHGTRTPAVWLQAALGVKQDGRIGAITLAAVNQAHAAELMLSICGARIRLYGRLTSQDAQLARAKSAGIRLQAENTAGWLNRATEFLEHARAKMVAARNP